MEEQGDRMSQQDSSEQSTGSSGRGYLGPIGVRVLGESVFCHRAGLIAYESPLEADDDEPRLGPRLDFFTDYDERGLEAEYERRWQHLKLMSLILIIGLLLVLMASWWSWIAVGIVALPALWGGVETWEALRQFVSVSESRSDYRSSPALSLDLMPTERMRVSWWSLRKAGFDCVKLRESMTTPDQTLRGQPWRVLRSSHARCLPVIQRPAGKESYGTSHAVRLAAYCHLIEACETASSPFGIILYRGTYECDLIPITPELKALLRKSMESAATMLAEYSVSPSHPPRPDANCCRHCPLGRPSRVRPGVSEHKRFDEVLRPVPFDGLRSNGSVFAQFHSACGDRFHWCPPHEDSERLRHGRPN